MNESTLAAIQSCCGNLIDPETGREIGKTGQLGQIDWQDGRLLVNVALTTHAAPLYEEFKQHTVQKLREQFSDCDAIDVQIQQFERPPQQLGTVGLAAKSVIAVGSGKGGVGKSTVASCLALALKQAGCQVGLLDADVYGPSIPQLLGIEGEPPPIVDNKIQPIEFNGMPVMSIGLLVATEEAVIWRGPMLHSAITRFVRDVNWGPLDYLIIDMPPGTGDVALSLSQMLPLTGSVVVCTPQKVALLDAIKAVAMFQKVNIPVIGLVENMSTFICPDNQKRYDIFGSGGVQRFAEQTGLPLLGELPIQIGIRQRGDDGQTVLNLDDPSVHTYLDAIATNLARELARRAEQERPTPQLPILQ